MFCIYQVCHSGYSNKIGDVTGYGLTGSYKATLEKCKEHCDSRKDCGSFLYSETVMECKLMKEKEPTGPKYNDFMFCSRNTQTGMV